MQKTMTQLITEVQRELYQQSGAGVQVYSQDRIQQLIQQAYEHCIKQEFWPQYRKRETRVLDGVTGQVTVPFTFIQDWEDIQHVFRENSDRPLPITPPSANTLSFPPTGVTPRFIEASGDSGLFRVYPLNATGTIQVVGRQSQATLYGATDIVPFDHLALVHFASWSYYTDDASNPASAAKHQGLFESRMSKIKDDSFEHAVQLNPHTGYIPDRWYQQ